MTNVWIAECARKPVPRMRQEGMTGKWNAMYAAGVTKPASSTLWIIQERKVADDNEDNSTR